MAGSPHQLGAGAPANEPAHDLQVNEVGQDVLNQASISVLIGFFKLLDQWDREVEDHAEIM
jgi:hypothetical protein